MTVENLDFLARAKEACKRVVDGFETPKAKHADYGYRLAVMVEQRDAKIGELRKKIAALELMRAGKQGAAADLMDAILKGGR